MIRRMLVQTQPWGLFAPVVQKVDLSDSPRNILMGGSW